MSFKKNIVLVLCFLVPGGLIHSSVGFNRYHERIVPLTNMQLEDMHVLLSNDEFLSDVTTNLDAYLTALNLEQNKNLFQEGLSYRIYEMLKNQLNYMLTETMYAPIFYLNMDTQKAQDNVKKQIEIIQKLLDYITLLEYKTKKQDLDIVQDRLNVP